MKPRPHRGQVVEDLAYEDGRTAHLDLALAVAEPERVSKWRGRHLDAWRGTERRAGIRGEVLTGARELSRASEAGAIRG